MLLLFHNINHYCSLFFFSGLPKVVTHFSVLATNFQDLTKSLFCAGDLLRNTGNLIDKLFDVDDTLCRSWSKPDFIQSLLEAIKQVR